MDEIRGRRGSEVEAQSSYAGEEMGVGAEMIDQSVRLAAHLLERSVQLRTHAERRRQAELNRMLRHPFDKATLVQMIDQAFRPRSPHRAADQLRYLLAARGVPHYFSPFDRFLMQTFRAAGRLLPALSVRSIDRELRKETSQVIITDDPRGLPEFLRARTEQGVRMNVNFLGEAIHGEEECRWRLQRYLQALRDPAIEVLSIKISTLFSQIDPVARERTEAILCDRLAMLYHAAAKARFRRRDGATVPKFIYLDMEEYRDMSITADVFMRTLERPEHREVSAGLALQAYLPDAFATQKTITAWALRRFKSGGAPIRLRIVKGANLEMERIEASLRGWPQAPFTSKEETDANYLRMLRYGLDPARIHAVNIGVASHNLFDLAFAKIYAETNDSLDGVQFEMLEGMADPQRRALFEQTRNILLYAPVCREADFEHAIGYLIRRFDENTGPDHFLRHLFGLDIRSEDWRSLEGAFRAAFLKMDDLPELPRRTQDRRRPQRSPKAIADRNRSEFGNEPDTDFSLPHHAEWAESIYRAWHDKTGNDAVAVPLVVGGKTIRPFRDRFAAGRSLDPSRPRVTVACYPMADERHADEAVACARADPAGWRALSAAERGAVLRRAAQAIRDRRADLMGAALCEGGKVLAESDPEVSEAVDFCEFYARSAEDLAGLSNLVFSGVGVVAVVPPWNFPISIPCGGVAAALAAGNTVILKPAPNTVLTAYLICESFWTAGVPKTALQFIFGTDEGAATRLVTHDDVDAVVFTGGTETALHLRKLKPDMRLLAETGGKNAIIVTAMADRDLAIKHIVQSAFGHAGQKCSAASLLILEDEVFHDLNFRRALCDAVRSLPVGSAWEPSTKVSPLIGAPDGRLATALRNVEPGELWAVAPHNAEGNPSLWTPAIKWDVRPGSFTHMNELFGPVLSVMRARNLDEAIDLVHATGYGLTSGLESLDEREHAVWAHKIRAGNLYINRTTTGAVVLRQPFGGMGKSAMGPGIKTGGPHYLIPLMRCREIGLPRGVPVIDDTEIARLLALLERQGGGNGMGSAEPARLRAAAASYLLQMREEFGLRHDSFKLLGQDNFRLYRPAGRVNVRMDARDSWFEIVARLMAASIAGCSVEISYRRETGMPTDPRFERLREALPGRQENIELREETDGALAERIRAGEFDRVRYAAPDRVPAAIRGAAAEAGLYIEDRPVLMEGRVELLAYLQEQSLCVDYHRYGNLGSRAA